MLRPRRGRGVALPFAQVSEANQAAIDDAHDQTLKNIAKMDNLTKTALDANKGALDAVRCYEPKSAVAGRHPAIRRRALPAMGHARGLTLVR